QDSERQIDRTRRQRRRTASSRQAIGIRHAVASTAANGRRLARQTGEKIAMEWRGTVRNLSVLIAATLATASAQSPSGPASTVDAASWPPVSAPLAVDAALERRVADLLARMTLEEKIGQVIQ